MAALAVREAAAIKDVPGDLPHRTPHPAVIRLPAPGDDFLLVNDRSQNLLQLWPPLDHDQNWPPKFVFDDEAYERFSAVAFPES